MRTQRACACAIYEPDARVQGEAVGSEGERVRAMESAAAAMSLALDKARSDVEMRMDQVDACMYMYVFMTAYNMKRAECIRQGSSVRLMCLQVRACMLLSHL
jgi:hypothetical protein